MADAGKFKDVPDDISAAYLPYIPTLRQKQRAMAFCRGSYIKSVNINRESDRTTIKSRVYRSQRKSDEPHSVHIEVRSEEGKVTDAHCSCKAGYIFILLNIACLVCCIIRCLWRIQRNTREQRLKKRGGVLGLER